MELTGKVKVVKPTQQISDNFAKREFVITTNDQYPQSIQLEVINDKCSMLDNLAVGDNVRCSINIRGREWTNKDGETKYFNTIQVWRIEQVNQEFKPDLNTKEQKIEQNDDMPF